MTLHRHRIIPGHMGGKYVANNITMLTASDHAEAHRILYEEYGHIEDYCAWQGLLKNIGHEEIIKLLQANRKGVPVSIETREKMRQAKLGTKRSSETKVKISKSVQGVLHPFYGRKHSEEVKKKISRTCSSVLKGRVFTEEHKQKLSAAAKRRYQQ